MKKLAFVGLSCLLLSGCSHLIEDTYSSVTVHNVAPVTEGMNYITVESYHELVNALLQFVSWHEETGQIRLVGYEKVAARVDLERAVAEVLAETALGSYGVERIDFEVNAIVGNLEAEISLVYDKTVEDFEAIIPLSGTSAIVRSISQGISAGKSEMVLQNTWASSDRSQLSSILQRAISSAAYSLVEIPQINTVFHPKEGLWRMLEMEFVYELSPEALKTRQDMLTKRLEEHSSQAWASGETDLFQYLFRALVEENTEVDTGETPYDVLIRGKGNSRGFSLSVMALCQEMNLTCQVVEGTLWGETRYWNMITTAKGQNHHVDVLREPENGVFGYYSDQEMDEMGYVWNMEQVSTGVAYVADE